MNAICGGLSYARRSRRGCPTCQKVTDGVACYSSSLWWGVTWRCCECGDSWDEEGYREQRPFKRGWRKEATRRARLMWGEAGDDPPHIEPDSLIVRPPAAAGGSPTGVAA